MPAIVFKCGLEHSIFIAEFLIHTGGIQPGRMDHIRHRTGFVALPPKQTDRLIQDVISIVFLTSDHAIKLK